MGRNILVAGYPRSGNSWFNYMLANTLGAKWIDLQKPDVRHANPEVRRRTGWGDVPLSHYSQFEFVHKSHLLPEKIENISQYSNIIYIVRDPRDVAVSYYFFKNVHVPKTYEKKEEININDILKNKTLWKKHIIEVADEWSHHTRAWINRNSYLVKYEDLNSDCLTTMINICNHLKCEINVETIKEVVNYFEFEKRTGRKKGDADISRFERKGISGDYKNYFSFFDRISFKKHAGEMMKLLKY